jgi:hypothetical protein
MAGSQKFRVKTTAGHRVSIDEIGGFHNYYDTAWAVTPTRPDHLSVRVDTDRGFNKEPSEFLSLKIFYSA